MTCLVIRYNYYYVSSVCNASWLWNIRTRILYLDVEWFLCKVASSVGPQYHKCCMYIMNSYIYTLTLPSVHDACMYVVCMHAWLHWLCACMWHGLELGQYQLQDGRGVFQDSYRQWGPLYTHRDLDNNLYSSCITGPDVSSHFLLCLTCTHACIIHHMHNFKE